MDEDSSSTQRKVEIPVEELLRLHSLMEKLIVFFHQPLHYQEVEDVVSFLQDGVYQEMSDIFYYHMRDWLPSDITTSLEGL